MATVTSVGEVKVASEPLPKSGARDAVRDSLIVSLAGQVERVLGTLTSFILRWGLDPARLGVYTGLRLYLDNTNRSSLGVGLGAVQEIPILRAAGKDAEARKLADIAHTTNTLTCILYTLGLLLWAWLRRPLVSSDPLATEWTWGLVAVAFLAILKRYESFLIAVLRARQEFAVTAKVDVVESLVSIVAFGMGVWLAGLWGVLVAVAVIILAKIAYLHLANDYRFGWAWSTPTVVRLMVLGLPILANTAVFGMLLNLDRVLILWLVPDGEKAVGLYSIAVLGTSWSMDLAGRIVTVLYTYFQTTMGRTRDPGEVARQAMRATEGQAPLLAFGSAIAFFAGPVFLGTMLPKYAEGLPAMRPLLPGMLFLGLTWPARQMLITIEKPLRLFIATSMGLGLTLMSGIWGAKHQGIVGVAWGMTFGFVVGFFITEAVAFVNLAGFLVWVRHLMRLFVIIGWSILSVCLAASASPGLGKFGDVATRLLIVCVLTLPALWFWARRQGWDRFLPFAHPLAVRVGLRNR